jgi:hypothetical protein
VNTILRLALAAAVLLCGSAGAQEAHEYQVKAAYLSKFPSFINWPPRAGAPGPFVIAVIGANDVAAELRELTRGRSHEGRGIEVRELADAQAARDAQLLFVGRGAAPVLPAVVRAVAGASVLIVSESPGALDQGSAVNFVVQNGRVRFAVSLPAASRAGLHISPRMLSAASEVRGERP